MSRFRRQWFDPDEEPEGPAEPELSVVPMLPQPIAPPDQPLRGRWIDEELAPAEEAPAAPVNGARRVRIVKTPRWTTPAMWSAGVALLVIGGIAALGDMNVARALIVAPVLTWIAYSFAKRFAQADGQPALIPILMGGLAVKFLGVLARYWIGLQVYGTSDATEYARYGRLIAPGLRHFHLIDTGKIQGTNFIRVVTGFVFALTPASYMGGFLVFGFMSYVGTLFFWRAFKRAFPTANDIRYLQILILLPSMAFWPSAIGKDAWMVLGVGIASYGVANILTNRTLIGWGTFIGGIYMILAVRPQVGVAIFIGLVVAEVFRSRGSSQVAGRAGISIVLMLVFGSIILSTTAAFLGISSFDKASINSELDSVGGRTSEGRSEFQPHPVNNPIEFPLGAFTVLFRPMPYEIHSPQEMLSAIENVALLGVIVYSLPRLWLSIRRARKRPYLLYCFGTIVGFVVMYSSFSNFAIIARERTQITALLLVLIALPLDALVEIDTPKPRPRAEHRKPHGVP